MYNAYGFLGRFPVVRLSVVTFIIACATPIGIDKLSGPYSGGGYVFGGDALIYGWFAVVGGSLGWFANITLVWSWFPVNTRKFAVWMSYFFALWHLIWAFVMSEFELIGGPGSYFWYASILIMTLALFRDNANFNNSEAEASYATDDDKSDI